jgi:Holliday junction resolvase RusA-like endonuclease
MISPVILTSKKEMGKFAAGFDKLSGPLKATITAHMPIPASASKKDKQRLPGCPHTKKPDIDNIVKLLLDAFNGILYEDDGQISTIVAKKIYSKNPRTTLCLTTLK